MAFLNIKKNKKKEEENKPDIPTKEAKKVRVKEDKAEKSDDAVIQDVSFNEEKSGVIIRPRITEKAGFLSEKNTYSFEVTMKANKKNVKKEIALIYKVNPLKVRLVNIPSKQIFYRGKKGVKKGGRKAYVTLKEGDKIEVL